MSKPKKSLEERIKIVKQIKRFGQDELGLKLKDAFEDRTDIKKFGWLYVTPKYKLKSIFKRPYKFYKDIEELENETEFYSSEGFDTHKFLGEATGNKKCQITTSLLNAELIRQAYVIFHEGWHMTNTSASYLLEESTGDLVGVVGTVLFLEKYFPELKNDAEYQLKEFKDFSVFINDYYTQLEDAFKVKNYGLKEKEKSRILKEADKERKNSVKKIRTEWGKNRYNQKLNNAFFYRYHFYCAYYPIADEVYQKIQDLHETMDVFKQSLGRKDGIEYLNNLLKE